MANYQNNKNFLRTSFSKFYTEEEEDIYDGDFSPLEKKPNCPFSWCSSSDTSSSCYGSCLSSPVASEVCSTESETNQDDYYIAELTRQMAYDMLQDDDFNNKYEKEWSLDGASQQTKLSELFPSQEEVQIMGKLENLRTNGNKFKYQNRESSSTTSLSPTSVIPSNFRSPNDFGVDFQSKQALIDDQIRAIKMHKFKQDQIMKQKQEIPRQSNWYNNEMETNYYKQEVRQVQSIGRAYGTRYWQNDSRVNDGFQQEQRTGSHGVRAVFFSEAASKSGSSGTGVFLPRAAAANIPDTSNSQGCSTVLIPARVVQALKLHFNKVGVPSRSNGAISLLHEDSITGDMSFGLQLQENSQSRTVPAMNHHHPEISLPQEWTY